MWRCPKCGSTRLEQLRMPYGPMWCLDCYFRVEEKTVKPNPFYVEETGTKESPESDKEKPPTGDRLSEWGKAQRKKRKKRKKK